MTSQKPERFHFTVKELIEVLKDLPQDLPVLTSGYETGFENFNDPVVMNLKHVPENKYWDGEFQQNEDGDLNTFQAIVLQRVMRDD